MDSVASPSAINRQHIPQELTCCISRVVWCVVRTIAFSMFTIFILCLPLGDPEESCARDICYEPHSKALAYNYACNVYKFMITAVRITRYYVHNMSQFAGCVIVNALYDAKLKFYTILETIDREDLCRSVCCSGSEDPDEISGQKDRKSCKCRASKCCKRLSVTK